MNNFSTDCEQVTHPLGWRKHFSLRDPGEVLNVLYQTTPLAPRKTQGSLRVQWVFLFCYYVNMGWELLWYLKVWLEETLNFWEHKAILIKKKKDISSVKILYFSITKWSVSTANLFIRRREIGQEYPTHFIQPIYSTVLMTLIILTRLPRWLPQINITLCLHLWTSRVVICWLACDLSHIIMSHGAMDIL